MIYVRVNLYCHLNNLKTKSHVLSVASKIEISETTKSVLLINIIRSGAVAASLYN